MTIPGPNMNGKSLTPTRVGCHQTLFRKHIYFSLYVQENILDL